MPRRVVPTLVVPLDDAARNLVEAILVNLRTASPATDLVQAAAGPSDREIPPALAQLDAVVRGVDPQATQLPGAGGAKFRYRVLLLASGKQDLAGQASKVLKLVREHVGGAAEIVGEVAWLVPGDRDQAIVEATAFVRLKENEDGCVPLLVGPHWDNGEKVEEDARRDLVGAVWGLLCHDAAAADRMPVAQFERAFIPKPHLLLGPACAAWGRGLRRDLQEFAQHWRLPSALERFVNRGKLGDESDSLRVATNRGARDRLREHLCQILLGGQLAAPPSLERPDKDLRFWSRPESKAVAYGRADQDANRRLGDYATTAEGLAGVLSARRRVAAAPDGAERLARKHAEAYLDDLRAGDPSNELWPSDIERVLDAVAPGDDGGAFGTLRGEILAGEQRAEVGRVWTPGARTALVRERTRVLDWEPWPGLAAIEARRVLAPDWRKVVLFLVGAVVMAALQYPLRSVPFIGPSWVLTRLAAFASAACVSYVAWCAFRFWQSKLDLRRQVGAAKEQLRLFFESNLGRQRLTLLEDALARMQRGLRWRAERARALVQNARRQAGADHASAAARIEAKLESAYGRDLVARTRTLLQLEKLDELASGDARDLAGGLQPKAFLEMLQPPEDDSALVRWVEEQLRASAESSAVTAHRSLLQSEGTLASIAGWLGQLRQGSLRYAWADPPAKAPRVMLIAYPDDLGPSFGQALQQAAGGGIELAPSCVEGEIRVIGAYVLPI